MGKRENHTMYRRVFSYPLLGALVFVLLVGITLLDPSMAAAQRTPDLMGGVGRDLSRTDWLEHLPLALGLLLVVVAVDAAVFVKIVRERQRRQ